MLVLGALVLPSVWIQGRLSATLLTPSFLSGWILAGVLCLGALNCWRSVPGAEGLRKRFGLQLVIGALLLALFLLHVELRLSDGWIELALSIGFEALLASVLIGALVAFQSDAEPARLRRWMRIQAGLHWSVLCLALFHGIFNHMHSVLAHYLFYSNG